MPPLKKSRNIFLRTGRKARKIAQNAKVRFRRMLKKKADTISLKMTELSVPVAAHKLSAFGFSSAFSGKKLTLIFPEKALKKKDFGKRIVFEDIYSSETIAKINSILRKYSRKKNSKK